MMKRIDWAIVLAVLKFIGRLLWMAVRICCIIFTAAIIGGIRGLSRSSDGGTSARD